MLDLRGLTLSILAALVALPGFAQQSASYRLDEHTFNAGGRPLGGSIAASASYKVSLDAIGAPVALAGALSSPGHRMEAGFVPVYRPPGEVRWITMGADKQTLSWTPEPTVGDYSLYRGSLSALDGTSWGSCLESGVTGTSTIDSTIASAGNGFYYLVAARNRLGEEGTLGETSAETTRWPAAACP